MELILTSNRQYSYHDNDGCDRNYLTFYLNGKSILKQKIPFDTNWKYGFDRRTLIYDVHLLNGKIYQKRCKNSSNIRDVSYPISKKILAEFNIPKDIKIIESK